jgi:hypothetical protein
VLKKGMKISERAKDRDRKLVFKDGAALGTPSISGCRASTPSTGWVQLGCDFGRARNRTVVPWGTSHATLDDMLSGGITR